MYVREAHSPTRPIPTIKEIAQEGVAYYFGDNQWKYFDKIIHQESSWVHTGYHYPIIDGKRLSNAVGLCGTMVSLHEVDKNFIGNPHKQITWCLEYVKKRYDIPKKAWDYHLQHNSF